MRLPTLAAAVLSLCAGPAFSQLAPPQGTTGMVDDIPLLDFDWQAVSQGGVGLPHAWLNHDNATHDRDRRLAVRSDGATFVVGEYSDLDDENLILFKVDLAGQVQWSTTWSASTQFRERPVSLVVGTDGDVFVLASVEAPSPSREAWVARFDGGDGEETWRQRLATPGADYLAGRLWLDPTGALIVTASTRAPFGEPVADVRKLAAADGNAIWSMGAPADFRIPGSRSRVLPDGDVLVAGLLVSGHPSTTGVLRIDGQTGAVDWQVPIAHALQVVLLDLRVHPTVGIVLVHGGVLAQGAFTEVVAMAAGDGGLRWQWICVDSTVECASPHGFDVSDDGVVVVAGRASAGGLPPYAVHAAAFDGVTGQSLWARRLSELPLTRFVRAQVFAAGAGDLGLVVQGDATVVTRRFQASTGAVDWTTTQAAEPGHSVESVAVVAGSDGPWRLALTSLSPHPQRMAGIRVLAVSEDTGVPAWQSTSPGLASFGQTAGCADPFGDVLGGGVVAADGSSYVAGCTTNGRARQRWLAKFDAAGLLQWQTQIDGLPGEDDATWAIALGAGDTVAIAGSSTVGDQDGVPFVASLDAGDGQLRWQYRYTADARVRSLTQVAVDPSGDVVAAGSWFEQLPFEDQFLVKLSAQGALLWTHRFDSGGVDKVSDLAVAPNGDVIVGGHGSEGVITRRLAAGNGQQQWLHRIDGESTPGMRLVMSQFAGVTEVIAVGSQYSALGLVAAGIDAGTGAQRWLASHPLAVGTVVEFNAAEALPGGGVVATGEVTHPGSFVGALTAAFDAVDGPPRWLHEVANPAGAVQALDVAVAGDGTVAVAGEIRNGGEPSDVFVLGLDATSGSQRWLRRHDGGVGGFDRGQVIGEVAGSGYRVIGTVETPMGLRAGVVAFQAPEDLFTDGFDGSN